MLTQVRGYGPRKGLAVILNETGFWRLALSAAAGGLAVVATTTLITLRHSPKVPLTVGIATAVTAYVVDWYTERER